MLVALGTALSVRLSAIAAGVVVIALYGAAWIAGIMEIVGTVLGNERSRADRRGREPGDPVRRAVARRLVLPAVARVRRRDQRRRTPSRSPATPRRASPFIVWAVAYAVGWWLLADRWFRRRDL